MSVIKDVLQWNIDRRLNTLPFDPKTETNYIVEELLEMLGSQDPKLHTPLITDQFMNNAQDAVSDDERVDAFCDMMVFCIGAIAKLGYDPEKALAETLREISSRRGAWSDEHQKWLKDTSDEAKKHWVKADYSLAKAS